MDAFKISTLKDSSMLVEEEYDEFEAFCRNQGRHGLLQVLRR